MNRIDSIENLWQKCTGCMACVDACPTQCIVPIIAADSFKYSKIIDDSKCISCEKCYKVCPIENRSKNSHEQHLYAAYAKDTDIHNRGSSGGIFELLAKHFSAQNYYVCAAAFDSLTLKHTLISPMQDIAPLLKSKYIQSDTQGIFNKINELLQSGKKVFFCGTPCQVSALINSIPKSVCDNLFTADIICHGVPSQKIFNDYIQTLEKKHNGKISNFSFRVKDNKYKHAHGYSYEIEKEGKKKIVNGIYTDSTYYYAFKEYLIFRNSCYDCRYATLQRVSDITLADFWGIEKYDFNGNVDAGVSMIITNSAKGESAFSNITNEIISKEFPIQYGIDSNHCLTHTTKKPLETDKIISDITVNGYEAVATEHFNCSFYKKAYWLIPPRIRNIIRTLKGH